MNKLEAQEYKTIILHIKNDEIPMILGQGGLTSKNIQTLFRPKRCTPTVSRVAGDKSPVPAFYRTASESPSIVPGR